MNAQNLRWIGGGAVGALLALAGCAPSAQETKNQPPLQPAAIQNEKSTQKEASNMTELPKTPLTIPEGRDVAIIAGGCFWCTEAVFLQLKGVEKVESGYSGGHVENPSYEAVCGKGTGHAEAIQITFDPKTITYKELLEIFFTTHDPTTPNQQGADIGPQYRSAVFTHSDAQKQTAQAVIQEFNAQKIWEKPIVTEVTPYANFYKAEAVHQNYFNQNPNAGYCRVVIAPKVAKFRAKFASKLKL